MCNRLYIHPYCSPILGNPNPLNWLNRRSRCQLIKRSSHNPLMWPTGAETTTPVRHCDKGHLIIADWDVTSHHTPQLIKIEQLHQKILKSPSTLARRCVPARGQTDNKLARSERAVNWANGISPFQWEIEEDEGISGNYPIHLHNVLFIYLSCLLPRYVLCIIP